jgi:iron complex outermembrane receptor protein
MRNSQSSVRAQNVSRARIRGEELSLRLAAPLGLRVSGSFTRQSARDEGDVPFWRGNRLPQRPEREGYLRLDWRRGRLRATGDAHYIGENYLDPANRQRVPDRTLIGASLSASLSGEALRVTIEGKNLGDNQVVDVGGFPLPGRSIFVSCEARLAARSGANR